MPRLKLRTSRIVTLVAVTAVLALALGAILGSSFSAVTKTHSTTFTVMSTKTLISIVSSNTTAVENQSSTSSVPWSHNFLVLVNYTGTWELKWMGYHLLGFLPGVSPYVNGSKSGYGIYSMSIALSSGNESGLTLCAWAMKLDSSNQIMTLTVDAMSNSTSTNKWLETCEAVGYE
jgi:hypothetical protein